MQHDAAAVLFEPTARKIHDRVIHLTNERDQFGTRRKAGPQAPEGGRHPGRSCSTMLLVELPRDLRLVDCPHGRKKEQQCPELDTSRRRLFQKPLSVDEQHRKHFTPTV